MIDESRANTAALESYNTEHRMIIEIRQSKYLNNVIQRDHRAVKGIIRPKLGIELMHLIKKGQLARDEGTDANPI